MIWLLSLIFYLIGSLSFAIIIAKCCHRDDPRHAGSKNAGATNMMRIYGRKLGIITFILDFLKAFLPLLLIKIMGMAITWQAWCLVMLLAGHIYPVFFRFKGGKGVASLVGGLYAIASPLAWLLSVIWALIFAMTRQASTASLISMLPMAILGSLYYPSLTGYWLAYAAIIIFTHRANIQRLCLGQEMTLR